MKRTITKREVTDIQTLERLVVEAIDGIEPGLTVIDSRLLLGHATIDLVAQDARGSLVLMALGLRADEGMLLRIVDAYSWCLEYPESVQRHYPMLAISEARPPRVMFVMTRVTESFQRKIKQLSFTAVDAIEFHAIDVDGAPGVFFDTVARIRRSIAVDAAPDIAAPAPPVSEAARLAAEIAARRPKRIEVPPVDMPGLRLVSTAVPAHAAVAAAAVEPVRLISGASDAALATVEPVAAFEYTPGAVVVAEAPVGVAAEPIAEALIAETTEVAVPVAEAVEAPAPVAEAVEVTEPVAAQPAGPAAGDESDSKYLFSGAAKAAKLAEDLGMQLPKEGALTRQWIDFLNQLAAK